MKSLLRKSGAGPQAQPAGADATPGGKPRLLFVDHVFHLKTRSFDFLIDILRDAFEVRVVHIDPQERLDLAALEDPAEHVVIAQMDFVTPAFIAMGKRVTVVQMYDGSAGLPDAHYQLNRQARHLNFSVTLHARALSLGVDSHLVRYFPDPAGVPVVQDFSTLRGFFWQRLPRHGVNIAKVRQMLGTQLDSLHIHTPTDDGTAFDPAGLEDFGCAVTTSEWFETQSEFTDLLNGCNVFIAPRHAEGIGHAFLEAMARGMIVIAHDMPTHNEYISNWFNGVLFDSTIGEIKLKSKEGLARIGAAAREGMVQGHALWRREREGIVKFVQQAPRAQVPAELDVSGAVARIMAAYQRGQGAYVSTLAAYPDLGHAMGNWGRLRHEIERAGRPQDTVGIATTEDFFFGYNGAEGVLGQGWSVSEPAHVWAVSREAELLIPLERGVGISGLSLEIRGLASYPVTVLLDGNVLGEITLEGHFKRFDLELEQALRAPGATSLRITLRVEPDTKVPQVEARPLSFALKALSLSLSGA